MRTERYIRIHEPRIVEDRKVLCALTFSNSVKKYFLSNRLYIEYEKNVGQLDPSLLVIPVVSSVITVAWAIGADVYVEQLDQAYWNALNAIRPVMKSWFPDFVCRPALHVRRIVANRSRTQGYGILFTGGVDSVASYLKHAHKAPDLLKVWGAEVACDDEKNWQRARKMLVRFADREGMTLHIIRSNAPRLLNKRTLHRAFGLEWWINVCHGIVLTGLCAPLTCVTGIGMLFVASGGVEVVYKCPNGSNPLIDNKIAWADVKVRHDAYDVSRQQKIRDFVKPYVHDHSHIVLKVCNDTRLPASNCGHCEKCLRTIANLVIEGLDPNQCGFQNVDSTTFDLIKKTFLEKRFFAKRWIIERRADVYSRIAEAAYWKDAQRHIPATMEHSLPSSREFLDWFSAFNLADYVTQVEENTRLSLPYSLYMTLLTICDHLPESTHTATERFLDFWAARFRSIQV